MITRSNIPTRNQQFQRNAKSNPKNKGNQFIDPEEIAIESAKGRKRRFDQIRMSSYFINYSLKISILRPPPGRFEEELNPRNKQGKKPSKPKKRQNQKQNRRGAKRSLPPNRGKARF